MFTQPTVSMNRQQGSIRRRLQKTNRSAKAEGDRLRSEFVANAKLQPPVVLRLIDIDATCNEGYVLLRGYKEVLQLQHDTASSSNLGIDYSAISHTFGMEVYSIFDCACASTMSPTANVPPRCCMDKLCPHDMTNNNEKHVRNRIVSDILEMCHILRRAGVLYAWHDGVCIAQYNEEELTATIQSIGWIYAAAKETIVFLHYVGKPMAPIAPRGCGYDIVCRWHRRVWTFQEAALSKSRRYCVRVCKRSMHFNRLSGYCDTLNEFEKKAKKFEQKACLWYDQSTSKIDVIAEETFLEIVYEVMEPLQDLWDAVRTFKAMLEEDQAHNGNGAALQRLMVCIDNWFTCIQSWFECVADLRDSLVRTCLHFPELGAALEQCSRRDSKHMGDRINSVLALAGLKNLVAPKDFKKAGTDSMETWTLKFFEQQGQQGLAWAALCVNEGLTEREDMDKITHSWVPLLCKPLSGPQVGGYKCDESWNIQFRVREDDGKLELTGELLCVAVTFKLKLKEDDDDTYIKNLHEKVLGNVSQALDHKVNFDYIALGEGKKENQCSKGEGDTETEGEDDDDDLDSSVEYSHGSNEDEVNTSTDCDEAVEGNGDHEDKKDDQAYVPKNAAGYDHEMEDYDEAYAEDLHHQAMFDYEEMDIEEHVEANEEALIQYPAGTDDQMQRMAMDIVSISTDGSHGFAARLPEADPWDIMGMVTFFPLQVIEDGRVIGGEHIKEGESLQAYLVAPLHYDWIISSVQPGFLIILCDHIDNTTSASKIGIFNARKTKAERFLRFPYKIIDKLVIN